MTCWHAVGSSQGCHSPFHTVTQWHRTASTRRSHWPRVGSAEAEKPWSSRGPGAPPRLPRLPRGRGPCSPHCLSSPASSGCPPTSSVAPPHGWWLCSECVHLWGSAVAEGHPRGGSGHLPCPAFLVTWLQESWGGGMCSEARFLCFSVGRRPRPRELWVPKPGEPEPWARPLGGFCALCIDTAPGKRRCVRCFVKCQVSCKSLCCLPFKI